MKKYIFLLTAIVLFAALSGCSGNTVGTNDKDIPAIPIEELTNKFKEGIYQEVEPNSRKVKNFDTKEQWIQHMSSFMDEDLAKTYANDFFYEEEDGLYLRSRGGPIMLITDKPYELKKVSDREVQVTQINETEMTGKYQLTVTFKFKDDRWIIQNYDFKVLEAEEESLSPDEAEKIISTRADNVLSLIADKNMEGLIDFVHPEKGVRFSPYSYVDIENDLVFKPTDLQQFFSSSHEYCWGSYDGTGEPILLTPAEYYNRFIYNHDFKNADQVSYNKQLFQGNMINNAPEVYPGAIIVEYHFEGFDEKYAGMDWQSLRLVFEKYQGEWLLVGIIHDEWTT